MEATPRFVRRVVIVLVDDSGQSTIAALRYAISLRRPTVWARRGAPTPLRTDTTRGFLGPQ
jgi:hypothetical protein